MILRRAVVFLCFGTLLSFSSVASARSLITSNAGCGQEFRGNKRAIKSCRACVKNGRFKKNARKKTWSCQVKKRKKKVIKKTTKKARRDSPNSKSVSKTRRPGSIERAMKRGKRTQEQLKHARNLARIKRLQELGGQAGDRELTSKATALRAKENKRHKRAMTKISRGGKR